MDYPTLQGKLLMPEYGRNVQHMVEYAMEISDRDERNKCASAIVQTMAQLHPELNQQDKQFTFYDHLAILSDFRLDIDYPSGLPDRDEMRLMPAHLGYSNPTFPFRHYGRIIQAMVNEACRETDEAKRHYLTIAIGNRLKYTYLLWNKDQVENGQVIEDIRRMSQGQLSCDFPGFELLHAWQLREKEPNQSGKKKKKK